jgi:hypothetical protein
MKERMKKKKGLVGFLIMLLALLVLPGLLCAATSFDGVLACQGSNALLSGGTDGNQNFTRFRITNLNDVGPITIERILVYSDEGDAVCDFPNTDYSLRPGFKYILEPHQQTTMTTLHMNSAGCLAEPVGAAQDGVGSVSVLIYWSYLDKDDFYPLYATYSDTTRDLNSGNLYGHIARGQVECKEILLKK